MGRSGRKALKMFELILQKILLQISILVCQSSDSFRGVQWVRRFLGKTLGKTKLHPSIFGKDHRLHPSIENPKAAAAISAKIIAQKTGIKVGF